MKKCISQLSGFLSVILFVVGAGEIRGEETMSQVFSVAVTATVSNSPAQIQLSWPSYEANSYTIYRKIPSSKIWVFVGTAIDSSTGWTDENVVLGDVYNYRVQRSASLGTGYGYVTAAIERPLIESRGKVILIVDDTMAIPLTTELDRLEKDLVGDGWTVIRHDVPRVNGKNAGWTAESKDAVIALKNVIMADYNADPANVKSVFIIGHVAVPWSGQENPDGHASRALPADVYYGDVDGTWTDSTVNINSNVPGDGKFDQSSVPGGTVELAVGRVDLFDMPSFAAKTETELLRQYLNKDHNYRHKLFAVQERGLIDDNFAGRGYGNTGYINFGSLFGSNVYDTDFFTTLATEDYLWAYGCGGGQVTGVDGVGHTWDFAVSDPKVVFTMFFGSYSVQWDKSDNFIRAPLGTPTYTLTCSWGNWPMNHYHPMGLGETTGYCMQYTQNQTGALIHEALMGDPTLRMHLIAPVNGLSGSKTALSWVTSAEAGLAGYHVFRQDTPGGAFTRLTSSPIAGSSYSDATAPSGEVTYMVRPVKFQITNSGSYWDMGQGAFLTVGNAPVASNQTVSLNEDSQMPVTLSAIDADGNSLTYKITGQPSHGSLSGTAPNLIYTPTANYNGSDSFTFKVNDGEMDSNIATVSLNVAAVNDAPVANNQSVSTTQDATVAVLLDASDIENDSLTWSYAQPSHGNLSGTTPNLTYTPVAGYSGPDSFTFTVNDGQLSSNTATVSITVTAVSSTTVTVKASDATASEVGNNQGRFTFTRVGSTANALTVNYTISGTAIQGTDYQSLSGSVTITAGQTKANVDVTPLTDSLTEATETVIITLSANSNYAIGSSSSATVNILDAGAQVVSATATDANASEAGLDTGTITISRTGPTTADLIVNYTIGGAAINGVDYQTILTSVVIPAGSSSVNITITPINDLVVEGAEIAKLTLSPSADYALGASTVGKVTIADND